MLITFVILSIVNGDHHDRWDDSTSHVIEIMAPVAKYAGPGGWSVISHSLTVCCIVRHT